MRLLAVFLGLIVGVAIFFHCPINAQTAVTIQARIEKLIDEGHLQEARELLNIAIKGSGETPAMLLLAARLSFKQRRFIESIQKLERVIAAANDPSLRAIDAEAHKLMGLNLVLINRLDLAEPFLKDAAAMLPGDHLARFHLGMLYYTTSRFAAAETELREAIRLDPEFVKSHDTLGLTMEELGKDEEALAAYRRAIELNEQQKLKDLSPYLNLGKFLLAKNRYEESLQMLEKASFIDGGSAEAAFQLGKAFNKLGREADAVKALNRAIRNDPDYAEPHYLLSRIYLNQGREKEAGREMRIFQKLQRTKF